MTSLPSYMDIGPFRGVPEPFRRQAAREAQNSAERARSEALRVSSLAEGGIDVAAAVAPSPRSVERGGISAVAAVSDARRHARMQFGMFAVFATFFAGEAVVPLLRAIFIADVSTAFAGLFLAVGSAKIALLWFWVGRDGYETLRSIRTKGYVGNHLDGNAAILAGKCWIPGEEALYISRWGLAPMTVPYHRVGLVTVNRDAGGLETVFLNGVDGSMIASIVPLEGKTGDGAERLAQTIRLKTVAALAL